MLYLFDSGQSASFAGSSKLRGRLSVSTREISRGLAISAYTGSTGHEAASPHHAMVSDLIHDRLGSSRAKGTFKAYGSAWNSYLKICSKFDIIAEPVTVEIDCICCAGS